MKTTIDIDDELLRKAMREAGVKTKAEAVEQGLRALLARSAALKLRALRGKVPPVAEVPRRR